MFSQKSFYIKADHQMFTVGMLRTKVYLVPSSVSPIQFLFLWVFTQNLAVLLYLLIELRKLFLKTKLGLHLQEMIEFLVDVWEHEGLYDWRDG